MIPQMRHFIKLNSMLCFLVALFIWAPAAAAGGEPVSDKAPKPCRGLKPFNNLDELLYQFYINLDRDCLFDMPVKELKKLWDTDILIQGQKNPGWEDFRNKPYKSEKDAFFIEVSHHPDSSKNEFKIVITREYYQKHVTLFPNGNYPNLLPEPESRRNPPGHIGDIYAPRPKPKYRGRYLLSYSSYYWENRSTMHQILMEGRNGITQIRVR